VSEEGREREFLLLARGLMVGRKRLLLANVDLRLAEGESWFVLGQNGSGKSTLLATLLGLLPSLGGELRLGRAVADRRRIGYVPQEQRFDTALPCTVAEFVTLGLPDAEARHVVSTCVGEALEAMQMSTLANRQVHALSLGQRRRVLVARALARRPRLLLLDEPTASLDGHGAAQLAQDLERLRERDQVCLVHVAHDLRLARRYATHVAFVASGAVTAGPAAQVFADPRCAPLLEEFSA